MVKKLILHTEVVKAKFAGIATQALRQAKKAWVKVEYGVDVQVPNKFGIPI